MPGRSSRSFPAPLGKGCAGRTWFPNAAEGTGARTIARAIETQRIGWLPKIELARVFQEARKIGELVTITW